MKTLVFTCGDINGISPEVCVKTINQIYNPEERKIIFFCPANIFENTADLEHLSFRWQVVKEKFVNDQFAYDGSELVTVVDIGKFQQNIGKPTIHSGNAAFVALKKGYKTVASGKADAMVTAPVSKTALKLANIKYPGQTELLAKLSKSKKFLMVFLSDDFICGLTTIHEPLKKVSKLITKEKVKSSIRILYNTLQNDLRIESPKVAVLGLNPHAGENGNIGREEINAILPAIKSLKNIFAEGPFPPDAFFGNKKFKGYDAVLGMYHDQVLIPFKMMNFERGVNYTAGLPLIRTSPDHGTGYDIAGKGIANSQSMVEAVKWVERIILNRRKNKDVGKNIF
ncbi:MAG: 4-hydroxythreonine-4-phosphate dehydrogenase PdxA [Bacteroidota bacterium]